jgi:hypothetical protein
MKAIKLGRLAVLGAAVALAVPAVASANEVTKWNEIVVSTVNAQPPITSAPPAGAIFVAMVQGAVYGAVNAADRHGRPYLVMRSFPKASKDAAAATAAFRVLDSLFPAQHATLQAAYNISLAGMPDGPRKETGIEVGTMAADAMLARGTTVGRCWGAHSGPAWRACGSHWLVRPEPRSVIQPRGWGTRCRSWSRAPRSSAQRDPSI